MFTSEQRGVIELPNIRSIDPQLYRLARAEAVKEGKTIGQWLSEAIKEKLAKKKDG
jgi:predicted HicB family RNase H-like nuclease